MRFISRISFWRNPLPTQFFYARCLCCSRLHEECANFRARKKCGVFEILDLPDIKIWTSSLIRTILTAKHIRGPRVETPILDELKSGYLDGLTYNDVMNQYPEEYHARDKDKLNYRYPGGKEFTQFVCCMTRN